MPALANTARAASSSTPTASLNTAWPSMRNSGSPRTWPPQTCPGTHKISTCLPSAWMSVAKMPGVLEACSTTAPAPSPNSTQVVRSLKSRMRENTSAPTTSAFLTAPARIMRIGHRQRIDEAAAHRLHVKRRRAMVAQFVLQNAGRRGKHHVGRGGGHDDQVEVFGLDTRRLQGIVRGHQRQVAAENTRIGKMPGTDAGALNDPFVAGLNALGGQLQPPGRHW